MTSEVEKLSIDLSRDSKRNAYSHHCDKVSAQKNYSVCLHLMAERKKGALPIIYSECSAAIGNKSCPAIKMRKEEAEKGQAIYFIERIRSEPTFMEDGDYKEVVVSNYKRGRKSQVTNQTPPANAKPKSAADMFLSGGAGIHDAINEAIKSEKTESKPKSPEVKVSLVQGESLAEMAIRIMKERQQKEAVPV